MRGMSLPICVCAVWPLAAKCLDTIGAPVSIKKMAIGAVLRHFGSGWHIRCFEVFVRLNPLWLLSVNHVASAVTAVIAEFAPS